MAEHAEIEFELAIISEPEGTELADIEGLSDDLALRVVGLTLARAAIAQPVEISLLMTGDTHIRELNRDFRGKDEATDVLSFPLLDEPLVDAPLEELWQLEEEDELPVALNGASMPTEQALAGPGATDYDEDEDEDELDDDDDELDDDDEASEREEARCISAMSLSLVTRWRARRGRQDIALPGSSPISWPTVCFISSVTTIAPRWAIARWLRIKRRYWSS